MNDQTNSESPLNRLQQAVADATAATRRLQIQTELAPVARTAAAAADAAAGITRQLAEQRQQQAPGAPPADAERDRLQARFDAGQATSVEKIQLGLKHGRDARAGVAK
jgi:hypothetical protein